jgi:hypothetical protein
MKKLMALMMAVVCVMTMSACSGEKQESVATFTVETVNEIQKAGAFSEELEELDADTAFMLYKLADYGLNREDLTQAAVVRSAGATCEEGAVLIFVDADKAAKAADAMGDYLEGQIEANVNYRPAEIPKLEGAILMTRENSLLLVVPNDAAAVRNLFEYQ